jgi:hypothetical protein
MFDEIEIEDLGKLLFLIFAIFGLVAISDYANSVDLDGFEYRNTLQVSSSAGMQDCNLVKAKAKKDGFILLIECQNENFLKDSYNSWLAVNNPEVFINGENQHAHCPMKDNDEDSYSYLACFVGSPTWHLQS